MKTILYSQIIRKTVDLPHTPKKAKLVEVLAKRGNRSWRATEIQLETGLIGKKGKYYPTKMIKDITKDGNIILRKEKFKGKKESSKRSDFNLSRLKGNRVIGSNGKEIGRLYDFEISIEKDPWIIWKLLVKPSGLSPKKRRTKISTKRVKEIEGNDVRLKEER